MRLSGIMFRSEFDSDGDGKLSDEEIEGVTYMYVYSNGISSLKEIEYFTALTELSCGSNQLTELDVSKNTALTYLNCYSNNITELDVRSCPKVDIYCDGNVTIIRSDNPKPEILTDSFPDSITGASYYIRLKASGSGTLTWSRKGNLPTGLTLSKSGEISGTLKKPANSRSQLRSKTNTALSARNTRLMSLNP